MARRCVLLALATSVSGLNVARLSGVSLKPVFNGQASNASPVEAGSLWRGTGAVIFTVRRAG